MGDIDWRSYWNSYRKGTIRNEGDLFIEVGKTVEGRPISREQFQRMMERIVGLLQLSPNDKLLELCCGNGLMTRALAPRVAEIEAVDFSDHLIAHACAVTKENNVRYCCADALEHLERLIESRRFVPNRILLGDALAYFDPAELRLLLERVLLLTNAEFLFLASNVPFDRLKWNFYNTLERKQRYLENQRRGDGANDGLGRWWSADELRRAGDEVRIEVTIIDQPETLSDYRVDVLFRARGLSPGKLSL